MSIVVSALPLDDGVQLFPPEEVHRYKSSSGHFALHLDLYRTERMSDKEEDEDRERKGREREQMMAGCTHW